jgi:cytokinin dehydrogenase
MEVAMVCTRVNLLLLILSLCSPYKFIQSPMDFGPLNLLPTTTEASSDFGRILFHSPSAVLKPQSPRDISLLLSFLSASSLSKVTVAARGAGHSIHGQAQALDGIVVDMCSLPSQIEFYRGEGDISYADVSGGAMWIELLEQSLKLGLAPRSWTDYLYITIGGTLSNAGISGQTFKHGPQISNVLQLEVVTGTINAY